MDSIRLRVINNRGPCNARGCGGSRYAASNYCLSHRKAHRLHGHPLGRRILKREWARERAEVAATMRAHSNHAGVGHALAWLQELLSRGAAGDSATIAPEQFARLASQGVTAREVLEACAAVWTLSHRRPHYLPDDARLDFALANAVLHLRPFPVRKTFTGGGHTTRRYHSVNRATHEQIGSAIRQNLGPLLWNLATWPERAAAAKAERTASFFAPFTSPDETRLAPTV